MKHKKTNAMRMLERQDITYQMNRYEVTDTHMDGEHVAEMIGVEPSRVFKTLVLENANHAHFVFVIPVNQTLDMKKAAQAVREKKLHLLPLEQLKQVTGYIRGGCSPIGMKSKLPTIIDATATGYEMIYVSGGERGLQIQIEVSDLIQATQAEVSDVSQR